MNRLLEVEGLVKRFGSVRAVDEVTFSIDAGQTLALVGESGCGKSTTGRCLLRLLEPDAGVVRFQGNDILRLRGKSLRSFRRRVQVVFQDPYASLNPRMTIGQAVEEPLRIHRLFHGSALTGRVTRLLEMVGLRGADSSRYPHQLSGGQRQRVALARALASEPLLVVADEPTSALDVSVQAQIVNLLLDLQDRLGLSYLFISHNLAVVRHISHRTAVMYMGRIVEVGPTVEMFSRPRHPYTQALLAAVPTTDPGKPRQRLAVADAVATPSSPPAGCRYHPLCPHAQENCRHIDPPRVACGRLDHEAACHLLIHPEGTLPTEGSQ